MKDILSAVEVSRQRDQVQKREDEERRQENHKVNEKVISFLTEMLERVGFIDIHGHYFRNTYDGVDFMWGALFPLLFPALNK